MERKKYVIDGREYETFELSNEQLIDLIVGNTLTDSEKAVLKDNVVERFKHNCCARSGENNDDVFARQFGNFVNGKVQSKKKVAELMACDHRYLQNEMFKIFLEYVKILAKNYENGYFDGRNEYACMASDKIIDFFKEIDFPY